MAARSTWRRHSDEARRGIAAAMSPVDHDDDEAGGDGETHARHVHLLKNRVDPRAQLARAQHAGPCLRKVRCEIVPGNIDETAHVLVTIAEHRDDATVDDLLARDPDAGAKQPYPRMEPQRCDRELLTKRDEMSRRLTCTSSWHTTARWNAGTSASNPMGSATVGRSHPNVHGPRLPVC